MAQKHRQMKQFLKLTCPRYWRLRNPTCGKCIVIMTFLSLILPKISGVAVAFQHSSFAMVKASSGNGCRRTIPVVHNSVCKVCDVRFDHSKDGSQRFAKAFTKVAVTLGCLTCFDLGVVQAQEYNTVDRFQPIIRDQIQVFDLTLCFSIISCVFSERSCPCRSNDRTMKEVLIAGIGPANNLQDSREKTGSLLY
jgi:hypothetical protein